MVHVVLVTGILVPNPPISFNCLVPVLYSIEPEQRNRRDLSYEKNRAFPHLVSYLVLIDLAV